MKTLKMCMMVLLIRENLVQADFCQNHIISLKLNTDGVAIFQSSQFGVWPLFLLVNELPPSLRYVNKSKCLYDDDTIILHQIGEKEHVLVHHKEIYIQPFFEVE